MIKDRSTHGADCQRVSRPVAFLVGEYEQGFIDPNHSHERSQLIYAPSGVMSVVTSQGSYVIPPQRAVWIPSGIEHAVHFRTQASLRTLYVAENARRNLPSHCRVIAVPNLLRELILEAVDMPIEYDVSGRDGKIVELILDEIVRIPEAKLYVPMPKSERLNKICIEILNNPARNEVIDELAKSATCSRRTFTRRFRNETGMSFATWRQHVRLLEAISRLAEGQSVNRVAFDVGYSSQSAFTAMFHQAFGTTPTEYLASR